MDDNTTPVTEPVEEKEEGAEVELEGASEVEATEEAAADDEPVAADAE